MWTHVLNFTAIFSASPAWLCITLSNGQVCVAQEVLEEVAVRKCLCVTGLDDRHLMCHRLLWTHSVPGWGWERRTGVQSYSQWSCSAVCSSGIIFLLLIHTIVPFSWCQVYLDRKSSLEEKNLTTQNVFALPFQPLLFFNAYVYPNITAYP